MSRKTQLAIIIPCFNEELVIEYTVKRLLEVLKDLVNVAICLLPSLVSLLWTCFCISQYLSNLYKSAGVSDVRSPVTVFARSANSLSRVAS